MRQGLPEDVDFDPSYRRARTVARYLLGIAINRYPEKPEQRLFRRRREATRQELIDCAIKEGLVWFVDGHHAPLCLANNWSKQLLPEGPCTCGAAPSLDTAPASGDTSERSNTEMSLRPTEPSRDG